MAHVIATALAALVVGLLVFVGTAEHYEQTALKASCVAARGHYYKVGDRRWNGLCVKADGILWDRSQ